MQQQKEEKKRIKFLIKKQKNQKNGAREQNYVDDIKLRQYVHCLFAIFF